MNNGPLRFDTGSLLVSQYIYLLYFFYHHRTILEGLTAKTISLSSSAVRSFVQMWYKGPG